MSPRDERNDDEEEDVRPDDEGSGEHPGSESGGGEESDGTDSAAGHGGRGDGPAPDAGESSGAIGDPAGDSRPGVEDGKDAAAGADDDDEEIEILEVVAADASGVRLPDDPDDDEEEIVVDTEEIEDLGAVEEGPEPIPDEPSGASELEHELREKLLRTAADFENFRKRVDRDRADERRQASAGLIRALLPVMDSLRLALAQGEGTEGTEGALRGFVDGMRLVESQLFDILGSAGLKPVDTAGLFDPGVHEALMQEPSTTARHLEILDVFEPGYTLGGRLLRPARVKVASNPDAVGQPDEASEGVESGESTGSE